MEAYLIKCEFMSIAQPDPASDSPALAAQQATYQQVLADFALTKLRRTVQDLPGFKLDNQPITQSESELIAALLVEQLANNLDSQLVAAYLKAIRMGNQEIFAEPINLQYPDSTDLPTDFPAATPSPRFIYGDRLRYIPLDRKAETDRGIVIGRYYCYASHRTVWMWRYILWLAPDSPSAAWLNATAVWEDNLEPNLVTEERA
jgi:hypothetical protein